LNTRQSGFSLLESIVALVILSMVVGALFAWQHVSYVTLDRARAHAERNEMVRSALAIMDHVNMLKQPEGERTAGSLAVKWSSKPVAPRRQGRTFSGHLSLFDLQLFTVRVMVLQRGRTVAQFRYRKLGYVQARKINEG